MSTFRVLLVEDDKPALEHLAKAICKEGFTVLQAQNGKIALEIFEKERPEIVITDLKMPDIGGMEVLHRVKDLSPNTQVIIITAFGEVVTPIQAIREGAIDYIKKPIDLDQMMLALGRAREKLVQFKYDESYPAILIAEDDEHARIGLSRVLEKEGLNIISVSNGQEAVDHFRVKKVDIVLLDIKMPGKDGIQALHEMRELTEDFEAIILTAYGDESSAIQAMRDGAFNFIKKPIDIEQLLVSVDKAVEKLTLSRALRYRSREIELMREILKKVTEDDYRPLDLDEDHYELFQKKVGTVPISMAIVDEDMCLKYVNPPFTREFPRVQKIDKEFLQVFNRLGMDISHDILISSIKNIIQSETGAIKVIGREPRKLQILLSTIETAMGEKREKLVLMVIPISWAVRSTVEQAGIGDGEQLSVIGGQ